MSAVYDIPLKTIKGADSSLGQFSGKVLLVVNVASKCGLTPQYEGLEALYRSRRELGLEVLGFPANNFKAQEPGTEAEIEAFCTLTYAVDFPLFAKISVSGNDRHPLYTELTRAQPHAIGEGPWRERLAAKDLAPQDPTAVLWNFEKFLIDREGQVVARFAPDVKADDERLLAAIDLLLTQG